MFDPTKIDLFQQDGFAGPFDLTSPDGIDLVKGILGTLAFNEASGGLQDRHMVTPNARRPFLSPNNHFSQGAILSLAKDPAIIEALGLITGSPIYLRRSQVWRKPPNCRPVMWHQDTHKQLGLGFINEFSAWVALEDATKENGCLWFLKGSLNGGIVPPERFLDLRFQARFYNSETLEIPDALSEFTAVPMEMKAGQFVLFHQLCFHASGANKTDGDRIGIAFRYLPEENIDGIKDNVTLVT